MPFPVPVLPTEPKRDTHLSQAQRRPGWRVPSRVKVLLQEEPSKEDWTGLDWTGGLALAAAFTPLERFIQDTRLAGEMERATSVRCRLSLSSASRLGEKRKATFRHVGKTIP